MVDIYRLKVFLHAACTSNFSETARVFNISQPTVSKYIHDLEVALGIVLFERSGTHISLTDAGKTLFPWIRKVIYQSNELEEMAQSLHTGVSGNLKIVCSTAAGEYILPHLASRFRKRHPQVQFSLLTCTPKETVYLLDKEKVDLGVVSCEPANNLLECQHFFSDHIILIVPEGHPFSRKGKIEPQDLLSEPILLREEGSGTRRALLQALAAHGISYEDLNIAMEVGSPEAIVASVGAGIGVSFVSRMSAAYALGFLCVVEVPVIGLEIRRNIYLVRSSLAAPNRVQEVFCGFIHEPNHNDLYQLAAL